jgi:uncharacterized protein
MKILLYFGHPAQFMMFRQTIRILKQKGWEVKILIKTKDVLENLVKDSGFEYQNILQEGRDNNPLSILLALFKRDFKLGRIVLKFRPILMIGTDPSIAHVSWLLRIPGITIVEDDDKVIKNLVRMTYPFTRHILCPGICNVGKYGHKKIGYNGFMKLGYLHPNIFQKNDNILKKYDLPDKFVLIRLSALSAYHDGGIGGISRELLDSTIEKCIDFKYEVKLSAEFEPGKAYDKYRLKIEARDMHHVLSFSSVLISDSQSMSVEAAILGIPSVRYSGFVGQISVLEELEHKYNLTFGIPIGQTVEFFKKIDDLLQLDKLKEVFQYRRIKMLSEKINLTDFLVWFIENYPQSVKIMKENPDYQYKFI